MHTSRPERTLMGRGWSSIFQSARLAEQLATRQPREGLAAALEELALLLLGEAGDVPGVVEAVVHERPVARQHRLRDLGEVLQHADVQRGRAPDLVAVEHLEQSPEPDPVAVLVSRVLLHVGQRASRPGIARAIERREIFVVLDVGRDPEGDARVVRPPDDRAVDHRQVIHPVRS